MTITGLKVNVNVGIKVNVNVGFEMDELTFEKFGYGGSLNALELSKSSSATNNKLVDLITETVHDAVREQIRQAQYEHDTDRRNRRYADKCRHNNNDIIDNNHK